MHSYTYTRIDCCNMYLYIGIKFHIKHKYIINVDRKVTAL